LTAVTKLVKGYPSLCQSETGKILYYVFSIPVPIAVAGIYDYEPDFAPEGNLIL